MTIAPGARHSSAGALWKSILDLYIQLTLNHNHKTINMNPMKGKYVPVLSFEDPFGIKEFFNTPEGKEFKKACEMKALNTPHEVLVGTCDVSPCPVADAMPINMLSSNMNNEINASLQCQNAQDDDPNNNCATQHNECNDSLEEYDDYDDYDACDDYDCYRRYSMEDSLMDALDGEPDAYWNIRD